MPERFVFVPESQFEDIVARAVARGVRMDREGGQAIVRAAERIVEVEQTGMINTAEAAKRYGRSVAWVQRGCKSRRIKEAIQARNGEWFMYPSEVEAAL